MIFCMVGRTRIQCAAKRLAPRYFLDYAIPRCVEWPGDHSASRAAPAPISPSYYAPSWRTAGSPASSWCAANAEARSTQPISSTPDCSGTSWWSISPPTNSRTGLARSWWPRTPNGMVGSMLRRRMPATSGATLSSRWPSYTICITACRRGYVLTCLTRISAAKSASE